MIVRAASANRDTAVSRGERVSGEGGFFSRRRTGEGLLPYHQGQPWVVTDGAAESLKQSCTYTEWSCGVRVVSSLMHDIQAEGRGDSHGCARDPSPVPLRLMTAPAAGHPLPKGEGVRP